VTTTWTDVLTLEQKEEQRKEIAKQIEEYLARGGKITQCPRNAYTDTDIEGKPKRKFDRLTTLDSLTDPTKRQIGGFVLHKKGQE
jgi:hypothetical protein